LISQIRNRNELLWRVGVLHWVLLLLSLVGWVFDPRLVGGVNPWIKPIKFDLSIVVYLWTMAWILAELPKPFATRVSRGMAASMIVETILIGTQAARGVRSHFNSDSAFDIAVYALMGIVIMYNYWLLVRVTVKFLKGAFLVPGAYLLSIRLGLLTLLLGNAFGVYMSAANQGHSVGVADGGPGLPILNWSTVAGDLRVAHFLGLHGIQILLLVGWWVSRPIGTIPEDAGRNWVWLTFILLIGLCVGLFLQAVYGVPLLRRW
jgi:hypothetical protein